MNFWKEIVRRVSYLGRRSRFDHDLEDEVRFHIETRAKELEQSGQSSRDALLQAQREFGSSARMREDTRAAWQFQWIEHLFADLRHATRTFRRRPAFALTAIACLTLGIGANTLIFSLVNAVLLRSLPYPDADRLVTIWFTPPNRPSQKAGTNALGYFTLRDNNPVFDTVGAARLDAAFNVAEDSPNGGARERVQVQWFTIDLPRVLGVNPILGRWPTQSDDTALIISNSLWQRMFGGAPDVVGKKLQTDFGALPVLGVMPAGFELLNPDVGFWIFQTDPNLRTQGALRSVNRLFTVFARLKPGVTVQQAQAEMTRLAPRLAEEMPESHKGWGLRVETLHDVYVGQIRKPLLIFQGAVFFVLLIACANVAGLLLAHASARKRELALRAALGSSRWRIARQLLTESMLLSLIGGSSGLALAAVGLRVFTSLRLAGFPRDIALDTTVVGFTLLLSLGTGLIFGALPALQISRPDLMEVLRESTRSLTASGAHQRLRGAFV